MDSDLPGYLEVARGAESSKREPGWTELTNVNRMSVGYLLPKIRFETRIFPTRGVKFIQAKSRPHIHLLK